MFEEWGKRDPVGLYEEYLVGRGIERSQLEDIEDACVQEADEAAEEALSSRDQLPSGTHALYEGFSEGGVLVGLEQRPIR